MAVVSAQTASQAGSYSPATIATRGRTQIRYWGLSTRLQHTRTIRHVASACPNPSRPVSCCPYVPRQPPTRARSAPALSGPARGPTRLYEWNEWSGATGRPTNPLSQSSVAGTDSTWSGRRALYTNGASQPVGSSAADTASPAATAPTNSPTPRRTADGGRPRSGDTSSARYCSSATTGSRAAG